MKELLKQILSQIEADKEYNINIDLKKVRVNPCQFRFNIRNLEIKQIQSSSVGCNPPPKPEGLKMRIEKG